MRRFRKEFGLKKARILRERLIPVSQRLKIGINRHPLPIFIIVSIKRRSDAAYNSQSVFRKQTRFRTPQSESKPGKATDHLP